MVYGLGRGVYAVVEATEAKTRSAVAVAAFEDSTIASLHTGEREFFTDNLLVRIHLIIVMISVDRPCAMGV